MSHEITKTDNVVMHSQPAWHGLGIVVEDAPTPREALTIGGIDWGVQNRPVYTKDDDGNEIEVEGTRANYRADTGELLGVVGSKFPVVQNVDLADFCSALLEEDKKETVRCETVGSIRGGKQIWFLLKGSPFAIHNGDELFPYLLVSNGHDGTHPIRVTPTTIRTVCSNTLHMVIPHYDTGELGDSAIVIRHTANAMERLQEARNALKHYKVTLEDNRSLAEFLAKKELDKKALTEYFLENYSTDFGAIPNNPKTKVEQNRKDRAESAFASFTRRFDDERSIAGTSYWNAINAYSGLMQHDRKTRGQTDEERVLNRVESNLFGLSQYRTQEALKRAFALALKS